MWHVTLAHDRLRGQAALGQNALGAVILTPTRDLDQNASRFIGMQSKQKPTPGSDGICFGPQLGMNDLEMMQSKVAS